MMARIHPRIAVASAVVLIAAAAAVAPPVAAAGPNHPGSNRWIFVAKSAGDFSGLRADITAAGGRIVSELPDVDTLVAEGGSSLRNLSTDAHASGVAADHLEKLVPPDGGAITPPRLTRHNAGGGSHSKVNPDPAMSLPGLTWNVDRIKAPEAWKHTAGSPAVTVGVADTGLDYTHSELASQVVHVEDFTGLEGSPTICEQVYEGTDYAHSDAYWASQFGGPADTDWNGHGSWIGGNIGAALDGLGINGIAPKIKLVALKISQWCGYAYDSEILAAFAYAANNGIDVVSISFGGYLDLTQSDQALIYQQYVKTVAYAMRKGTLIVAAAGNEHVRLGAGGRVLSHGSLTTPGDEVLDLYGMYETPGGIPGVIAVSATGNVVNAPTADCSPDYPSAICKSTGDAHQPTGVGRTNQLAYYSNYGPRIDVAAPGGARKFNLPVWDGGGTPGWPVTTADGYAAWQDFSVTSDWALEIPCYYDLGPEFYPNDCYSTIQGTSMATPHASAVVALLASRYPSLRHHPAALAARLKATAQRVRGNTTQPLSASDVSAGDLTGDACPTGYCHLGGRPISDSDAYGAGLVNAAG
jgi:subtilisin family serine protease